jgi:hypothetical protein
MAELGEKGYRDFSKEGPTQDQIKRYEQKHNAPDLFKQDANYGAATIPGGEHRVINEDNTSITIGRPGIGGQEQIVQIGNTWEDQRIIRSKSRLQSLARGFLIDQGIVKPTTIETVRHMFGRPDQGVPLAQAVEAHIIKNTEVNPKSPVNTKELTYDRGICVEAVIGLLESLGETHVSAEQRAKIRHEIHNILGVGLKRTEEFDHGNPVDARILGFIDSRFQAEIPSDEPNPATGLTLMDELVHYTKNIPVPIKETPQSDTGPKEPAEMVAQLKKEISGNQSQPETSSEEKAA